MEQFFINYLEWEDYQNGLWSKSIPEKEEELIKKATEVLLNPSSAMKMVVEKWPIATKVNLTNLSSNRKSWLGQAACCIEHSVPEHLTRKAWMMLTNDQRKNANEVAKEIISQWEKNYKA